MLKKRSLIVGLALLGAIVIAGTGFVGCQKPSMFCGGGFHGKEFPKHVLEKIDSAVETLDLRKDQQARYEEIRIKVENELVEVGNQREIFFEKVKSEMGKENPDLTVLSGLVKSQVENLPNRVGMFIDDFMSFYEVLDENQKAVITTHLKKKFQKLEAFKAFLSS
ncbi:MAG: hypothetical protein HN366_05220 [Deltaproteobacteria bacterium]|jgi:hypothetical protein|nr:hypothetical protein [Deltaproteobacteria bacterium]